MALNGIQIFKLTPKKNCKECGCPTCMAFSMKVAQGAMNLLALPNTTSRVAFYRLSCVKSGPFV